METDATTGKDAGATAAEGIQWIRLPGLFRRWELEQVLDLGSAYRFEEAGATEDGTQLIAIYVRDGEEDEGTAP